MATFQKFMAAGYLSRDAEIRTLPGGSTEVAEFTIYTKEWQGKDKELKTEWFDCNSFMPTVIDAVKRGLTKGTLIFVEGKVDSSEYEKSGVKVKKYRIKVSDIRYLQNRNNDGAEAEANGNGKSAAPASSGHGNGNRRTAAAPQAAPAAVDDDCPF